MPDTFRDFLVASAGVAGALIGLLFVAISVRPEQIGEGGDASVRFRPSASLSALLNALLLSLLLLVPGTQVGAGVVAVGVVGLVAVVGLLAGLVSRVPGCRGSRPSARPSCCWVRRWSTRTRSGSVCASSTEGTRTTS